MSGLDGVLGLAEGCGGVDSFCGVSGGGRMGICGFPGLKTGDRGAWHLHGHGASQEIDGPVAILCGLVEPPAHREKAAMNTGHSPASLQTWTGGRGREWATCLLWYPMSPKPGDMGHPATTCGP